MRKTARETAYLYTQRRRRYRRIRHATWVFGDTRHDHRAEAWPFQVNTQDSEQDFEDAQEASPFDATGY
jgi:hypothetical protein